MEAKTKELNKMAQELLAMFKKSIGDLTNSTDMDEVLYLTF